MKKPNLLFIFSDQQRVFDMNLYGNDQVITPNFDKFSKESVVFNNCISNSPVCVPVRGSLLTGLYPFKHKAIANDMSIDTNVTSVADI